MKLILNAVLAAWIAAATIAGDSATIDLKDVVIKNKTDQHRESKEKLDASFGYHHEMSGKLKGTSGLFKTLYPEPTDIAQILEDFQEGSSAYLIGDDYNVSGLLPAETLNQRFDGEQEIFGIKMTFGMTFSGGISDAGVAYFDATDVVLEPSYLIGAAKFTEGSVVITRLPVITGDMDWDGEVTFNDIDPFVAALADPAGYIAEFGHDPIFAGDVNRDGGFDFNDIDPFVELLSR